MKQCYTILENSNVEFNTAGASTQREREKVGVISQQF